MQFPYGAKTFFFNCLDKLSNLLFQVGLGSDEVLIWKRLVSVEFIQGEWTDLINQIPSTPGSNYLATCEWVGNLVVIDEMNPELLRDMRNTNHGYGLKRETVQRIYAAWWGIEQ